MARVLRKKVWYEQVEPSTMTEAEFEDRIVLHAPTVYPDYFVLPFKRIVESPHGNGKPDLAFISEDYDEWYVVEVEMAFHPFSHVETQVRIFADGTYGQRDADYFLNKMTSLDSEKTKELITNTHPQVLVILNESRPDWQEDLSKYNAVIAVFELFRSENNEELFRVNGEYPFLLSESDSISQCIPHPIINRLLGIDDPDSLGLPRHGRIKLRYNNCLTEWQRVDDGDDVWLQPVGRYPLQGKHRYQIYKQRDGTYILQRIQS